MATQKRRVTLKTVEALQPGETIWDRDVPGLAVRRQKNCASYILKTRVLGRQQWITIGRHGAPWTPELARKEARRLLLRATGGEDLRPRLDEGDKQSITVKEAAHRFVVEHGPKLKPTSRRLYNSTIDRHILPKLGARALSEIGPQEAARLHLSLKATPRQANIALTVLSSLTSWAMDQKLIPFGDNPCQRVRRFTESKRERFLSLEELTRLARGLDDAESSGQHSIYAIAAIRLLILTGGRLNEILTLEWSQVFPVQKILQLPTSKTGAKTV